MKMQRNICIIQSHLFKKIRIKCFEYTREIFLKITKETVNKGYFWELGQGYDARKKMSFCSLLCCFEYFFFFFFGCTQGIGKFPGQGSKPSCSCELHQSYGNAGSLTHFTRLGNKLVSPQKQAVS